MTSPRARWGLGGLLVFEAILLAYTAGNGSYTYAATAGVGVGALAYAMRAHKLTGEVPRIAIVLVVVSTLARAMLQTVFAGWPVPNVLSYLVPVGFALMLAPHPRLPIAVGLIAAARSWFVLWYAVSGAPVLVVANVVGAAAAWYWWTGEALGAPADARDDDAANN